MYRENQVAPTYKYTNSSSLSLYFLGSSKCSVKAKLYGELNFQRQIRNNIHAKGLILLILTAVMILKGFAQKSKV